MIRLYSCEHGLGIIMESFWDTMRHFIISRSACVAPGIKMISSNGTYEILVDPEMYLAIFFLTDGVPKGVL